LLPAFWASLTSIQVISSTNTVSRASMGRGAPEPRSKGPGRATRTPAASSTMRQPDVRNMLVLLCERRPTGQKHRRAGAPAHVGQEVKVYGSFFCIRRGGEKANPTPPRLLARAQRLAGAVVVGFGLGHPLARYRQQRA